MTIILKTVCALICSFFASNYQPKIIDNSTKQLLSAIYHDNVENFKKNAAKIDRKIILPDSSTPLQFSIASSKWTFCPRLINEGFMAKPEDLDKARFMKSLETSDTAKEQASTCIYFLELYLQEQGLIPKIHEIKRGKDDEIKARTQELAQQLQSPNYLLIQAAKDNDVVKMQHLITHGAHPDAVVNDATPMDIAIAHSCEEAVQFLLTNGAKVTKRTEQRAYCYVEILSANTIEQDIQYPNIINRALSHQDSIRKAKRIHAAILTRFNGH